MPTYEYSCNDCGERIDVVQSIHDDSLTVCPNCGGTLRKLFGNVGVVFKGSGFYKNDSRENKSAKKGSAGASAGSEAADAGSGDKKQAAPSDAPSSAAGASKESSGSKPAGEPKTAKASPPSSD